jgi:hypothetical protein
VVKRRPRDAWWPGSRIVSPCFSSAQPGQGASGSYTRRLKAGSVGCSNPCMNGGEVGGDSSKLPCLASEEFNRKQRKWDKTRINGVP